MHFTYEVEPFAFDDAPDGPSVAKSGDHLVLFRAPERAHATWTQHGDVDTFDREGAQVVLVGRCRDAGETAET